ncbi:MAG: DUF1385 domain-containing protein [Armatimonadota bacterium]
MGDNHSVDKPQYGGQAVIEGVMMRGPRFFAVACRRANKEIIVKSESVETLTKGFKWLNKPFLRGTLALIDAMALGMKTLMFSANVQMEDIQLEEQKAKSGNIAEEVKQTVESSDSKSKKTKGQAINDIAVAGTMVLGLALGIGVFMIGPHLLVDLLKKWIKNPIGLNIAEGGVRISMFVGYLLLISLMKDIRRVFMYHGAEHRVINTYEAGHELTEENIAKYGTIHPRCGTSFIVIVLILSILVYSFLGWTTEWYLRIIYRLALLPVIAGMAYEIIKFAGKHKESALLKVLLAPGLLLQRITTRPPTDDQVEVALTALTAVIDKEKEASEPAAV